MTSASSPARWSHSQSPSAKTVSKASDDLPDPETPVMTVRLSWGISRDRFLRLFWRAPSMRSPGHLSFRFPPNYPWYWSGMALATAGVPARGAAGPGP